MVDADQCGDVAVEFRTEPFGETTARPVHARAGRGLDGFRGAGAHLAGHPVKQDYMWASKTFNAFFQRASTISTYI
jgi:hypothetical protein